MRLSLSRRRLAAAAVSLVAAATVGGVVATPASAGSEDAASYVVVLKDGAGRGSAVADEHRRNHGAQVSHTYGAALNGYAARLTPAALRKVQQDSRVAYVEVDGVAQATAVQTNPTYGLDRIDDTAGLDGTFGYTSTGAGVTAYIVDTGIRATHTDLAPRVTSGYSAIKDRRGTDDCNGHGTHVAGTVGGTRYGVAKTVTLVPVRVLDCRGSGSYSGIIAGLDWIISQHSAGSPAVANMSLGGGASTAIDDAVRRTIADGVTVAVAAGNGDSQGRALDACTTSPARTKEALTVSATDSADTKPAWANTGTCVDLFAPGVGVTSAWYRGDTSTNTISGTSMATPHVAGVVAQYLGTNSGATPAQVATEVLGKATGGAVKNGGTGSPNLLLFTAY